MENINGDILNIRSTSFGVITNIYNFIMVFINWQACERFTYLGQNGEEMHYWMIEIQIWQLNICMRVKSCSETSLAALIRSWKVFASSVPSGIFIYIHKLFVVLGVAFRCKEGYTESSPIASTPVLYGTVSLWGMWLGYRKEHVLCMLSDPGKRAVPTVKQRRKSFSGEKEKEVLQVLWASSPSASPLCFSSLLPAHCICAGTAAAVGSRSFWEMREHSPVSVICSLGFQDFHPGSASIPVPPELVLTLLFACLFFPFCKADLISAYFLAVQTRNLCTGTQNLINFSFCTC